ncbi:MAG TPA: type II secretion system protein [Bryobacteraceae bacterium]|nr:type II secretion system protein [Bryobacteraceae bacterium]
MRQVCRRRDRRGFSLIELLIVVAIILILAAVAAPKLNQNRMYTQETAAIQQIKTIHTAQVQYYSQFGRYATTLAELGPASSGQAGPAAADLIPQDLSLGKKTGYTFTVTGDQNGYQINAVPDAFGNTGRRTFFSDQSGVVRENWGAEPATITSKEIK